MSIATVAPGLTTGTWNIDPAHSEVAFVIRHLMTKVRGIFTEFEGAIEIADDLASSTAKAEIKVESLTTRHAERDAHVRSSDVLDIANHPVMTFESTGVREEGGQYYLDGALTIKDVTRPVSLAVEFNGVSEDPWGAPRRLQRRDHHQPQGLGHRVQRPAEGRGRPAQRQGRPPARDPGRPRLTRLRAAYRERPPASWWTAFRFARSHGPCRPRMIRIVRVWGEGR